MLWVWSKLKLRIKIYLQKLLKFVLKLTLFFIWTKSNIFPFVPNSQTLKQEVFSLNWTKFYFLLVLLSIRFETGEYNSEMSCFSVNLGLKNSMDSKIVFLLRLQGLKFSCGSNGINQSVLSDISYYKSLSFIIIWFLRSFN